MTSYWSYWFHILEKIFLFNIDVIHKCLMCLNWEVLASLGSHVLSNSSTIIIQYFILLLLTYWSTELTYFLYITYKILQAVGTYSWQSLSVKFMNLMYSWISLLHKRQGLIREELSISIPILCRLYTEVDSVPVNEIW